MYQTHNFMLPASLGIICYQSLELWLKLREYQVMTLSTPAREVRISCIIILMNINIDNVSVCHSLSQGVAALFGPNSPYTAHHVQVSEHHCELWCSRLQISSKYYSSNKYDELLYFQSICDSKEIPHIETRWDYRVGPIRY